MAQALYRKWRPARFHEVIGQEHVTHTLQQAVAQGRVGHAYLFSGPRGTGKTTTARLLAKAVNCHHQDLAERPCHDCPPCLAIGEGRFLDLIEIDAASNTGVDDIRDLRDKINFSPSEGRFKVYIIDEVHMLSTAAFNALLKTLEEPPRHAIFVLATTEEHKVPLTIKSRCQIFSFRLLTTQEIIGRLEWLIEQEALTIEPQAIALIARHGAGSMRDAESLLDQLVAAPGDTITLERAQKVLGTASDAAIHDLTGAWLEGDGAAGLKIIHDALATGSSARQLARQMVAYLRQLLLLQTAGGSLALDVTEEQLAEMKAQAKLAERAPLIQAVKGFNTAANITAGSWQPQLPLELAFIELLPAAPPALLGERPPGPLTRSNAFDKDRPPAVQSQPEPGNQPEAEAKLEKPILAEPTPTLATDLEDAPPTTDSAVEQKPEPDTESAARPQIAVEPEVSTAEAAGLTLALVTGRWQDLRDQAGQRDRALPALLASCKPLATEGNDLILGFDYPILKDKFDKKSGAGEIVADVLSSLLGSRCAVRTVITDQYTPPPAAADRATGSPVIDEADFAALAGELGGVVRKT